MGKHGGFAGFFVGSVVGASVGAAMGVLLAPRPGAETRAMAADAMNDAWDGAMDAYERQANVVADRISDLRPQVDANTDELRAKVDAARERMDQLRTSISETVATTSAAEGADAEPKVELVVDGAEASEVEAPVTSEAPEASQTPEA